MAFADILVKFFRTAAEVFVNALNKILRKQRPGKQRRAEI